MIPPLGVVSIPDDRAEQAANLVWEAVDLRRNGRDTARVLESWDRTLGLGHARFAALVEGGLAITGKMQKEGIELPLKGDLLAPLDNLQYATPTWFATYRAGLLESPFADITAGLGFQLAALTDRDDTARGIELDEWVFSCARHNLRINGYDPDSLVNGDCLDPSMKWIDTCRSVLVETSRTGSDTPKRFNDLSPDPSRVFQALPGVTDFMFDLPPRMSRDHLEAPIGTATRTCYIELSGTFERLQWQVKRTSLSSQVGSSQLLCISRDPAAEIAREGISPPGSVPVQDLMEPGSRVGLVSESIIEGGLLGELAVSVGAIHTMSVGRNILLPMNDGPGSSEGMEGGFPPFFEHVYRVRAVLPGTLVSVRTYLRRDPVGTVSPRLEQDPREARELRSNLSCPGMDGVLHLFSSGDRYILLEPQPRP